MPVRIVRRAAVSMNGIGVAYLIGFVNAVMATVNAFGINLNDTQRVAIVSLVNAALILSVHLAHRIGEATVTGRTTEIAQQQVAETPPPQPEQP